MDFHLELPGELNYIRACGKDGIRIGNDVCQDAVIVSPRRIVAGWPPQSVAQLEPVHWQAVFELEPEVVLLGTGARQVFLPPEMVVKFHERGTGIEVMTTEAACRTYNVLVTEGRMVVAALMPVTDPTG